jgi:hypothetical protein
MTRIKLKYVHAYTDVRGKLRRYFRRPGFKKIVLPGLPGSTEFMAAYEQALAGLPRKEIGADRTRPGTVNAAIVGYYQCLAFRELAPSTQAKRRGILERFRAKHGDKRVATLPQEFIRRELDQMKPARRAIGSKHCAACSTSLRARTFAPTIRLVDLFCPR